MSTHSNLMNLVQPQPGKMRQISSQGRQKPPAIMAAAIGPDEPGKSVTLAPGDTHTVADIPGAGILLRIWMTAMQPLLGSARSDKARPNANHDLVLRFYWDGESEPSIKVPFGAFFGVPWGKYTHYVAEPLSCTSGGYNCRFPMPFGQGARIEVTNEGAAPCPAFFFQVQYREMEIQSSPLRFHVQWRRENPTQSRVPYRVLDAEGSGHFCGMHLWMQHQGWWLDPARMIGRAKDTGSVISAVFPEALGIKALGRLLGRKGR